MDLDQIDLFNTQSIKFKKLKITSDLIIPRHHRTSISPEGFIFLTGGLESVPESSSIRFLNKCYIFDNKNIDLVEVSNLNHSRASHSLIYTIAGLLCVGGIGSNCKVTNSCELYDPIDDKWIEIGDLKEPTMNSALCSLNEKFVIKFGGKLDESHLSDIIEILDLDKMTWYNLNYKF